jgi:hypothetical protein
MENASLDHLFTQEQLEDLRTFLFDESGEPNNLLGQLVRNAQIRDGINWRKDPQPSDTTSQAARQVFSPQDDEELVSSQEEVSHLGALRDNDLSSSEEDSVQDDHDDTLSESAKGPLKGKQDDELCSESEENNKIGDDEAELVSGLASVDIGGSGVFLEKSDVSQVFLNLNLLDCHEILRQIDVSTGHLTLNFKLNQTSTTFFQRQQEMLGIFDSVGLLKSFGPVVCYRADVSRLTEKLLEDNLFNNSNTEIDLFGDDPIKVMCKSRTNFHNKPKSMLFTDAIADVARLELGTKDMFFVDSKLSHGIIHVRVIFVDKTHPKYPFCQERCLALDQRSNKIMWKYDDTWNVASQFECDGMRHDVVVHLELYSRITFRDAFKTKEYSLFIDDDDL